jgi:hypothetical protein
LIALSLQFGQGLTNVAIEQADIAVVEAAVLRFKQWPPKTGQAFQLSLVQCEPVGTLYG